MARVIRQWLLLGAGMLAFSPPAVWAQADSKATPAAEAERQASDADSAPAKKKKKGLFGKVKDAANNEVVKTVAKTAACTMVPGGQMIVGAIDAADSKDAGEAVGDAATTATGAGCMPGGLGAAGAGAAGLDGAGLGAGGLTGMAAEAGAAAVMGGQEEAEPDAADPYSGAMPSGYGPMAGMPDEGQIAACMGLTPEEYAALTNPTGGEPRQLTKDEMKRQQKLSKKVNMQRYQSCMMQAASQ